MKLISRKEAKAAGLKRYFTGKPCKRGHVAERFVCIKHCIECNRASTAAYDAEHREERAAYGAAYYAEHRGEQKAYSAKYAKDHASARCANTAKRKAAKLRATPSWSDLKAAAKTYEQCAWLTMASGIEHEVDHFIPLQGELVCGLHVPANLQIITAAQNSSKGNRYDG